MNIVLKHFSYWILVWYILYIIICPMNEDIVPSPYWFLVIAMCVNVIQLLYTIGLQLTGQLRNISNVWLSLLLFVLVNTCIKVIPFLTLHYHVFCKQEHHYNLQSVQKTFLLGLLLFVIYVVTCCWHNAHFNSKWFHKWSSKGLMIEDGPIVGVIKSFLL